MASKVALRPFRILLAIFSAAIASLTAGCASRPPGSSFPKQSSVALTRPESTPLGQQFEAAARAHPDQSAFHIISVGVDGFLMRLEMINAAKQTLDLQYYIFRGDETGRLLTDALVRAADRGVRVRILIDDGETVPGDEQLIQFSDHENIEIRVFNPWSYRGHQRLFRATEYLLSHSRLDYRMHNKLLIVDNAVSLVGGRNIGDQYFQVDPKSQFADDDVFTGGPLVHELSEKFDEYWNSELAIPTQALGGKPHARRRKAHADKVKNAGFDYQEKLASGEPLAGLLANHAPLVWASATVACDSPEKKRAEAGARVGSLMYQPVAAAIEAVQSEFLLVTPYFVPSSGELHELEERRERGARVRILTNSLESAPDVVAHSGYMHYRVGLLKDGVEIHEVRALLGSVRGSGQSSAVSRYGNYALHGKLFVFDRRRLYAGSMNFDRRSRHLNTEIGLIIDSPELAQETASRFEAMVRPESSYSVELGDGNSSQLLWRTVKDGHSVVYRKEPSRSMLQKIEVKLLSLLPLDSEL